MKRRSLIKGLSAGLLAVPAIVHARGLSMLLGSPPTGDDSGGAPDWLPEGATAFLDFDNDHYYAGGATRAKLDLFTNVILVGADTTQLLRDQFPVTGFTVVLSFDALDVVFEHRPLIAWGENSPGGPVGLMIELATNDIYATENSTGDFQAEFDADVGSQKIAATWKGDGNVVASYLGSAIKMSTGGSVPVSAWVVEMFGTTDGPNDAPCAGITPHFVIVYAAKADIELPALSTP